MVQRAFAQATRPLSASGLDPVVQKHLRRVYGALFQVTSAAAVGCATQMSLRWDNQFLATLMVFGTILNFMRMPAHAKWRRVAFLSCGFAQGWALGPLLALAAIIRPEAPLLALASSAVIFGSLSVTALFAKRRSYLYLGGFCGAALSVLALISLIARFTYFDAYIAMQLYGGLLVFTGYTLYDTQLIVEKAHAGERDELKHALELFQDLVAIFVRLLIILLKNKENRDREERRRRRDD